MCVQSLYAITCPQPPRKNPVWNPGCGSGPKNRLLCKIVAWSFHMMLCNLWPLLFFQVWISNGVLNSSATEVSSTTWPLPPTPVVTGVTNTSFSITVPLNQTHCPLSEIYVEVCARAYIIWTADHWNMSCLRICPSMMNFSGFQKKRMYIWLITWKYTHQLLHCHVHSIILALAMCVCLWLSSMYVSLVMDLLIQ